MQGADGLAGPASSAAFRTYTHIASVYHTALALPAMAWTGMRRGIGRCYIWSTNVVGGLRTGASKQVEEAQHALFVRHTSQGE